MSRPVWIFQRARIEDPDLRLRLAVGSLTVVSRSGMSHSGVGREPLQACTRSVSFATPGWGRHSHLFEGRPHSLQSGKDLSTCPRRVNGCSLMWIIVYFGVTIVHTAGDADDSVDFPRQVGYSSARNDRATKPLTPSSWGGHRGSDGCCLEPICPHAETVGPASPPNLLCLWLTMRKHPDP
jgi:hypothetical protein